MSTVVTLHVFSGRPNPSWVLDDNQELALEERLKAIPTLTAQKPSGVLGKLGYRGFSVARHVDAAHSQPMRLYIHEGIVDQGQSEANLISDNREIEQLLLDSAPPSVPSVVRTHVLQELSSPVVRNFSLANPAAIGCPNCAALDAPNYTPAKWNIPTVQPFNNCYNYANNQTTNTFAQPGRAHGAPITGLTCAGVLPSAQADRLVVVPGFGTSLSSGDGWYVALVIWPDNDYHWYRQDQVGCWSHKPGQTAARNIDNSGNSIADPATCDRGPYTQFCSYMVTKNSLVIT